ncbi:MAG: BadF/BadG/BcrA/BcrD ATPase family protein [Thermotogota bacterium]|nr:BadF/BadG/BcrA/BcrD ATPase family protein [Thermotogota bacterium]
MKYCLGFDVGNTKTLGTICTTSGSVLCKIRGNGANFQTVGIENSLKELRKIIDKCSEVTKLKPEDIDYSFFGMAGADSEDDKKIIKTILNKLLLRNYDFENDGRISLKASTIDDKGILITCGTGTVAFAGNGKKIFRLGGLSSNFGDRLGSEYIASRIISLIIRAKDGRGQLTKMVEFLEKKIDMPAENLMKMDYPDSSSDDDYVPILIEVLFKAGKEYDAVALKLLLEITEEIEIESKVLSSVTGLSGNIPLILDGHFFKNAEKYFYKMLNSRLPKKLNIVVPDCDPVVGALMIAIEKLQPLENDVVSKLKKSYKKCELIKIK